MAQKFPGPAVGVAQIYTAGNSRRVQVSQVSDVRCIFRNLLQGTEVTITG